MSLPEIDLVAVLADERFSRKEKILALLAVEGARAKQVRDIQEIGRRHGLREISKWNVSDILRSLTGAAVRLPEGWSITQAGRATLKDLGLLDSSPIRSVEPTLRKYLAGVSEPQVRAFVEEAVSALEFKLLRSAVVLSWQGAISVLHEVVLSGHLTAFNTEAARRSSKWKSASTIDDLAAMKEYDFLQVISGISLIGKNVKQELEACLKLRNACGHPNTYAIGEHRVASHLEVLILNVFSRFPI